MLPDFLIVGASRSGTTTLYEYLKQHPQIYMPDKKELSFFEKDYNYYKGLDFYKSFFLQSDGYKIKGEASPPYFHKGIIRKIDGSHGFTQEDAAYRIKQNLPNVKIIITLRNPIDRLYSQYWKNYYQGNEMLSLRDALKAEIDEIRTPENSPLCWLYKNNYLLHLRHWFQIFGKEQIKVIIFEEWIKYPGKKLQEVFSFLGLEQFHTENEIGITNKIENYGLKKNNNPIKTLAKLFKIKKSNFVDSYAEKNIIKENLNINFSSLENVLGKDLSIWKE